MTNSKSLHFNCSAVSKFITHSRKYYLKWLGQCHAEERRKGRYPGFQDHLSFKEILPLPHRDIFLDVFLISICFIDLKKLFIPFLRSYLPLLVSKFFSPLGGGGTCSSWCKPHNFWTYWSHISFLDVPPGRSHRAWCTSSMPCCYHLQILNIFYTGPHELCSQHW